jgi:hypothetical protein
MRRAEIIEGVKAIEAALEESGIFEALAELTSIPTSSRRDAPKGGLLAALKKYIIAAQRYNDAAKYITQVFGIHILEDAATWTDMIQPDAANSSRIIYNVAQAVRFAKHHAPKLLPLIEQVPLREIEQGAEGGANKYRGMQLLTITLYEDKNALSSPTRVANAIESINHFYYACAMMGGESPSTISVVALDSGSDKSIDFLGLAKVMECVERILNNIWDRVFFFREHQTEERLDLVAKALPIISQISLMKERGEIPPELAEQLNQNVFQGVNKFVQAGVSTPKIEDASSYNPRSLLSPVQRLLVSASEGEEKRTEGDASAQTGDQEPEESAVQAAGGINFSNLSPEEQEALRRLFEKAASGSAATTSKDSETTDKADGFDEFPNEEA